MRKLHFQPLFLPISLSFLKKVKSFNLSLKISDDMEIRPQSCAETLIFKESEVSVIFEDLWWYGHMASILKKVKSFSLSLKISEDMDWYYEYSSFVWSEFDFKTENLFYINSRYFYKMVVHSTLRTCGGKQVFFLKSSLWQLLI